MSDHSETMNQARSRIRSTLNDPVTKMLLDNSQLTSTQLETILAYSLSAEEDARKTSRRFFRPSGARISRGAYNRSLIQAQNNVIRSIYTILLLGYVGVFDTPALQPFSELSDTIQTYVHEARQTVKADRAIIDELNRRLLDGISALVKRQSFKDLL